MTIYIASSWRNQHAVEMLTTLLRDRGHRVVSFVEKAVSDEGRSGLAFDVEKWIASEEGAAKFKYDITGATTSDLVIYVGPSGPDAWAEVGAAFQSGRRVLGLKAKGEQIGLMRRLVDWSLSVPDLLEKLDKVESQRMAVLKRIEANVQTGNELEQTTATEPEVCYNCTHWDPYFAMLRGEGHCEIFNKTTPRRHGLQCTAFIWRKQPIPTSKP